MEVSGKIERDNPSKTSAEDYVVPSCASQETAVLPKEI
jgi:hypothetical protein